MARTSRDSRPHRSAIGGRWADLLGSGATTPSHYWVAFGLILISSVGFSFSGLILRGLEAATPWHFNFYRGIAMVLALLVILVLQHRSRAIAQIRGIGWMGLAAGACLGGNGVAFVLSMAHTTVANTMFVICAIPFFTAFLAWLFLREPVTRPTWVAMTIAALGILIMIGEGLTVGSLLGNALALFAAVLFAVFAVVVRASRRSSMMPTLLVAGTVTTLLSGCWIAPSFSVTPGDLLLAGLFGACLSGFGNWMFILAARHLAAAEATLIMLIEFVLGPLWVWWFVDEVPTFYTLAGGLLIMAAVAGKALADLRSQRARAVDAAAS